jgi:hypothetical protein
MSKILVPIKSYSDLALSASYFAIELAKRTSQAKVFFLIFQSPNPKPGKGREPDSSWQAQFEALVHQALDEKVNLELLHSSKSYVQAISQFVKDYHIGEVIIALPSEEDGPAKEIRQDLKHLQGKAECRLVTVKSKEEGGGSPSLKTSPNIQKVNTEVAGKEKG